MALALLGAGASPAVAAPQKTYHFFSKEVSSKNYTAKGKPVTNPNATPHKGGYFISTDDVYVGNHSHHAKRATATDHIDCTVISLSANAFTSRCDAQIALPGGMVFADRQKVSFSSDSVVPITGGTGKFAKVKGGKVKVHSFSQKSDDSDLTITLKF